MCYSISRHSKVLTVDVCGQYLAAQQSHAVSSMKAVQMKPLWNPSEYYMAVYARLCLKCDGTCAETRFRLSAKRTSPFKSAGMSVQSTTGSQGVRFSYSDAEYTMFRGSVKGTGYPLHLPVSPSLRLPCVTVCHHVSTGLYLNL